MSSLADDEAAEKPVTHRNKMPFTCCPSTLPLQGQARNPLGAGLLPLITKRGFGVEAAGALRAGGCGGGQDSKIQGVEVG